MQAQEIAAKRQWDAVDPEPCDERLDRSRMVWKDLSPDDRAQLLTISIDDLRNRTIAETSSAERGVFLPSSRRSSIVVTSACVKFAWVV